VRVAAPCAPRALPISPAGRRVASAAVSPKRGYTLGLSARAEERQPGKSSRARSTASSGSSRNAFEAGAIQDVVGLDLTHAPTLLTAECGGSALSVTGSVIGAVTAVNKMVTSLTLTYSASGGKQIPEQFEEEPKDTLASTYGGGPAEQTGLSTKLKLANEEKLEVIGLTG
jgi:hypothetical protein